MTRAAAALAAGRPFAGRRLSRANKYRNVPTHVDGIRFASKKEAGRYADLKLELRAGLISDLVCQPKFDVEINGQRLLTYRADFSYCRAGRLVIEDVKSPVTRREAAYRLRKKAAELFHNITVTEV